MGMGAPVWQNFQLESSNLVYVTDCNRLYVGEPKYQLLKRLKQNMYCIERVDKMSEIYISTFVHMEKSTYLSLALSRGWGGPRPKDWQQRKGGLPNWAHPHRSQGD